MHAACIHSLAVFCQNSSGNVCTDTKTNTETCAIMSKVIASFCSHISVDTPRYTMLHHLLIKCSKKKTSTDKVQIYLASTCIQSSQVQSCHRIMVVVANCGGQIPLAGIVKNYICIFCNLVFVRFACQESKTGNC